MGIGQRLRRAAETALGVLLAVTPVALWVAWTPGLALAVLGIAGVSAVLLVLVAEPAPAEAARRAELSDEFVEELHRLFPLVYHHSRHETPAFRRAMEKLRRLAT